MLEPSVTDANPRNDVGHRTKKRLVSQLATAVSSDF
jgi:hypothetical protein